MIKRLKSNPIFVHQVRNAKWPSLRTAVWITAALMVIGLALTISGYAISPDGEKDWVLTAPSLIWLIELLLLVLGPLLTVVVAVVATVRAIISENDQEIHLNLLSERDIVSGYLAGAVFRLRTLWMAAGGLALPSAIAWIHLSVWIMIKSACPANLMQPGVNCTPPPASFVFKRMYKDALESTAYCVALFIAWNWLAANLGIWMAFRYRHPGKGLIVALLVLVFTIVLPIVLVFSINGPMVTIIGPVAINIAVGWLAYRQAVRCVRDKRENAQGIQG